PAEAVERLAAPHVRLVVARIAPDRFVEVGQGSGMIAGEDAPGTPQPQAGSSVRCDDRGRTPLRFGCLPAPQRERTEQRERGSVAGLLAEDPAQLAARVGERAELDEL